MSSPAEVQQAAWREQWRLRDQRLDRSFYYDQEQKEDIEKKARDQKMKLPPRVDLRSAMGRMAATIVAAGAQTPSPSPQTLSPPTFGRLGVDKGDVTAKAVPEAQHLKQYHFFTADTSTLHNARGQKYIRSAEGSDSGVTSATTSAQTSPAIAQSSLLGQGNNVAYGAAVGGMQTGSTGQTSAQPTAGAVSDRSRLERQSEPSTVAGVSAGTASGA